MPQSNSPAGLLSEDIRLLGGLLGETIIEQAGRDIFDIEEEIRAYSKAWHDGDESANQKIRERVLRLAQNDQEAREILKAFATYFSLVNLAEEHQRIGILRERREKAFLDQQLMDESVGAAIAELKQSGMNAEQVQEILDAMLVMPVFTAHPTESKRKATRQTLSYLSENLFALRSPATPANFQPELLRRLRAGITLLWQSNDSRNRKPTVMDEVRNTGIYFFEHSLFDVVPKIYEALELALKKNYPAHEWCVPSLLKFGSWIGGDRDGNPFVSPQTTIDTILEQKKSILNRYMQDVTALYELLSPSIDRAKFDESLLAELQQDCEQQDAPTRELLDRFSREPYRQRLILIHRRLAATRTSPESNANSNSSMPYENSQQLIDDLLQVDHSLRQHQGGVLAEGQLAHLIRRVRVFGFHIASVDIRQHSGKHESAVAEILNRLKMCENYSELEEADRLDVLREAIAAETSLDEPLNWTEETQEIIDLMGAIAEAHRRFGEDSISSYVISMSESASDILEVLFLLSLRGRFGKLDIVPLFETVEDLKAAPEIMSKLFSDETYRSQLSGRNNNQQIMIGYSDSNKDGGFLRANWMLFSAQRNLAATCEEHQIGITLFHGRGGSIGRGGGPANRSIRSQPPESIRGRIRITEQGEVVSSRYTHQAIAFRHLQQLMHAVICSTSESKPHPQLDSWSSQMDRLSQIAFQKYRSLVEEEAFISYFQSATPIDQIDQLNLGSRPSRRKKTEKIDDLRAIPWVFAWTQSRTNIPSWFGVGTAIDQFCEASDDVAKSLEALQEMYREWPFFRSVMGNVHLGLGRADIKIAKLYSELADKDARPLFDVIEAEYQLTRRRLLEVTGHQEILETEPWLQHSIRMRNPYVDPLNYIQVALLERLRMTKDDGEAEKLRAAILQSINGIAAGLQNVG